MLKSAMFLRQGERFKTKREISSKEKWFFASDWSQWTVARGALLEVHSAGTDNKTKVQFVKFNLPGSDPPATIMFSGAEYIGLFEVP